MKVENNLAVIVYDGLCILCSSWVQFVISKDRKKLFSFVAMQSEQGKAIVLELQSKEFAEAMVLHVSGRNYLASDAAIEILARLGFRWKWVLIFKLVPRPLRDFFYRVVARNRYRWFGKRESCLLVEPPAKLQN